MAASFPASVKSFAAKSNGDVIEVAHVTGIEDEIAAIETELLQHNYGEAERSIFDRVADVLSVKDYCDDPDAFGDGTTDDAVAINACIEASALGARIIFPPPAVRYTIATPVVLKAGRIYDGPGWGVIFKQADGADLDALFVSEAYVENFEGAGGPLVFRDFYLDLNRANNTGNGHGLHLFNWASKIENIQVREAAGDGLHVEGGAAFQAGADTCVEIKFKGCRVDGVDGHGLRVVDASGNKITDGTVLDCEFADTGACGLWIDSSSGWTVDTNVHFYGIGHSAMRFTRAHQTTVGTAYVETYGQTVDGGTYYAIEYTSLVTGEPCVINGAKINHKDSQGGNTYFGIFARAANESLNARLNITGVVMRLNGGETGITLQVGSGSSSLHANVTGCDFYSVGDTKIATVSGVTLVAEGNSFQRAAAAPTAGAWWAGARVYNSAPAATGYVGWVCVTAGTPGTWKGFGEIEA